MDKNTEKKTINSTYVLLFLLLIFVVLELSVVRADLSEVLTDCSESRCFENITDLAISNDGSFFLVGDSTDNSYVRKVSFSSGMISTSSIIELNDVNPNNLPLELGISQNNKKAFLFRTEEEGVNDTFRAQTEQGTDCQCPSGAYFNETLCVAGTIECSTTSDSVCGCNSLNYLNSCVARANGVKKYTKGACSSSPNLTCSNDSQCPLGNCPNGNTFKRFTCTNSMCTDIVFSVEPCSSSSSSSSGGFDEDCRCESGEFFNGESCESGTLDCSNVVSDPVCGCDDLNYLNSCIAQANGVISFTKGTCGSDSNLSCNLDEQCPLGTCPSGSPNSEFQKFTCTNGKCTQIEFSSDPCLSSSGAVAGEKFSIVHIVDLTNNSVKTFTPIVTNKTSMISKKQNLTAVSFLDSEGTKLIACNDDEDSPKFLVIDSATGQVEKELSSPGIARSIEFSPRFDKALITFKDDLSHSLGIFNNAAKKITKIDIPESIFFRIDEFLSKIEFDLFGNNAVISSLGGEHVFYVLDKDNILTVRFLDKKVEGKTLTAISPDSKFAVSVGNIFDNDGIAVYKLNISKPKAARVVKIAKFEDKSSALDIAITPDNNNIFILTEKDNAKLLKVLNLKDLALVCEYKISDDGEESFLLLDPNGRYFITPDFNDGSISFISDIKPAPVFRSIDPQSSSSKGGTNFTIKGFVDPSTFSGNLNVCFQNEKSCATSVSVSDDGKIITGITPKVTKKGKTRLLFFAENNSSGTVSGSSSDSLQCLREVNSKSRYDRVFQFK